MGQERLQADMDAARDAITVAEDELRTVVGDVAVAPRAAKTKVSEVVQEALVKLRAAKAKLIELEESLELAKRREGKRVVQEAETYLDEVVSEMVVRDGAGTTWTPEVVDDAFAKLRAAKAALAVVKLDAKDED